MPTADHTITVQEAVKLTGLSRRTITYAARTGKLSAHKLPGRTGAYLLDLDEVRKYAELHRQAAVPGMSGPRLGCSCQESPVAGGFPTHESEEA